MDERIILKTRTLQLDDVCDRVEWLGHDTYRVYFTPAAVSVLGRIGAHRDARAGEQEPPFTLANSIESLLEEGALSFDREVHTGNWDGGIEAKSLSVVGGARPIAEVLGSAPAPKKRKPATRARARIAA